MRDNIKIEDIKIGSVWFAADGSPNGVIVKEIKLDTQDIIVQPFSIKNGLTQPDFDIDWFKLQYRYTPAFSFDGEMERFEICFPELVIRKL